MSNFSLMKRPKVFPMKCVSCNSGDREVIDLGTSIERHGKIYICIACVRDAAVAVGYVPKEDVILADKKYQILLQSYTKAIGRIKELKGVVDSLRNINHPRNSVLGDNFVSPDETLSGTVEGEGQNYPEPVEQDSVGESGSVSETPKLAQFS